MNNTISGYNQTLITNNDNTSNISIITIAGTTSGILVMLCAVLVLYFKRIRMNRIRSVMAIDY